MKRKILFGVVAVMVVFLSAPAMAQDQATSDDTDAEAEALMEEVIGQWGAVEDDPRVVGHCFGPVQANHQLHVVAVGAVEGVEHVLELLLHALAHHADVAPDLFADLPPFAQALGLASPAALADLVLRAHCK